MNPHGVKRELDTALSDEAIDWLVTLNSGIATEADRAAFLAWRRQSEAHEDAAREAEAIWNGVGLAGNQVRESDRKAKTTRRAVLGGTILLAGGVALQQSGLVGPHLLADYQTGIGEQRTVTLPDGSVVFLNAGTALSENFGEKERRLRLFHGEAVFTVAHDSSRPFIVETTDGHTRAVGTVFNIDIRQSEVIVTVLEGSVNISTMSNPLHIVAARADQQVRYGASGRPSEPDAVDPEVETAWRRGKLIFNRQPLGDVIARIERHRRGHIVIASNRLRSLEVTGVFDLADPEAVLSAIENTLPVRISRLPLVTILR